MWSSFVKIVQPNYLSVSFIKYQEVFENVNHINSSHCLLIDNLCPLQFTVDKITQHHGIVIAFVPFSLFCQLIVFRLFPLHSIPSHIKTDD